MSIQTAPNESGDDASILRAADGGLWVSSDRLRHWRVPVPKLSKHIDGTAWSPLRAVADLRYRYDACTQTLWVDTAVATQQVSRFDLMSEERTSIGRTPVEPGGYLNLDTQLLRSANEWQGAGLVDVGVFNAWGYGASGLVATQDRLVRLESYWNVDDPARLQRLRLGDLITRGSTFGQSARIGGVQWGRQFSLRPDLVTYPLPSFRGSAALASSVDVYVNQSLRSNQAVPTGPFELNRVPVVVGQGEVQLVVRDVLGREQVVSYPFYAAPTLLREGLTDYTVEAGWLRNDYGMRSADYGRFLGAVTYRKGITDRFTSEFHAELLHEQGLLAASGTWLQPTLGVFSVGLSGSGTAQGTGTGMQLGFERISPTWSLSTELRRASPRFTRAGDSADTVRRSELARIGFVPHPAGSLSLSYLHQNRQVNGDVAITALSYSYGFAPEWNLFATLSHAESQTRDNTIYVGLSWLFSNSYTGILEYNQDDQSNRARMTVQRNMHDALDYSWRVSTEAGDNARTEMHGQWTQAQGNLTADVEHYAGNTHYRAGYATGLAFLGGDVFWTRPVEGSFAVVDTRGLPGVRIYADEQMAGRSDARGLLLVPNVRTYETTQLRIEDSDVPMDYEIGALSLPLSLPTRGGARAQFDLHAAHDLRIRLLQEDGTPVPAGAQVTVGGAATRLPVGFEGQVYLQSPPAGPVEIEARWPAHRCVAHWDPTSAATLDLRCSEVHS